MDLNHRPFIESFYKYFSPKCNKIFKMYQNCLIFDMIGLKYELQNLVGKSKDIHVTNIDVFAK